MMISKQEARYILEWCDSVIQCETDAISTFPNAAAEFKKKALAWTGMRRRLRAFVRRRK